jgi:arylsulfatase A-like enzyme
MIRALLTGLLWLLFLPGFSREDPSPNIILFLVDDLGWRDAGFMGSSYYETPHMDQLAEAGMVFTSAYANAANCAPTRASLMSGLYPPRHGIYTVNNPDRGKASKRKLIPEKNNTVLSGDFITMAEALRQSGYSTCHVGKWHLGDGELTSPEGQGFDVNIGGNHSGHPAGGYFSPYKNPQLEDGPEGEYLTDRLTDEALAFIEAQKDDPFFLYFAHYAVHTPIQAKAEYTEAYLGKTADRGQDNATYASMIQSTDESLGRLIAKLDELDIAENTLVVFFSDNGGLGHVTSCLPLKGAKGMMYEGGIRVPMICWWPGRIDKGTRCDVPVMGMDFYPTFLEIAGADPSAYGLDGISLAPLIFQEGIPEREAIYWHFPAYLQGSVKTKYPENLVKGWRAVPSGAIRKGDWKLIEDFEDKTHALYNLAEDIGETEDLSQKFPEKAAELLEDLIDWRRRTGAPVPVEPNPLYVSSETD